MSAKIKEPKHKHNRIAVLDIETSGLTWGKRLLVTGVAVVSWVGKTKNREVAELTSPLMRNNFATGKTIYKDGWMSEGSAINTGMATLLDQVTPIPAAKAILTNILRECTLVVFHNGTFDIPYLVREQLLDWEQLDSTDKHKIFDTLIMARATAGHPFLALMSLLREYGLSPSNHQTEMKGKRSHLEKLSPTAVLKYAADDTIYTGLLAVRLLELIYEQYENPEAFIAEEGDYVKEVSRMRLVGQRINLKAVREKASEAKANRTKIAMRLAKQRITDSNTSLAPWLESRGVQLPKTAKGNPQIDLSALSAIPQFHESIEIPREELEEGSIAAVVRDVLDLRHYTKQLSTWLQGYLDEADSNGRIHPLYSAGGTVSYRLSCSKPNAQAVPKNLKIWGVPKGKLLVTADYSQAELRLGAAFAGENILARFFEEDIDIHLATSEIMYGAELAAQMRQYGKRANFTGFYGGGAPALADALGIGMKEAEDVISRWRNAYPNVRRMSKLAETRWADQGYINLSSGKRLWASPDDLEYRIYKAFNQVVQGSIAELVKKAMLLIAKEMPHVQIVGQIHDSLIFEIPDDEKATKTIERIKHIMETRAAPQKILARTDPTIKMLVDIDVTGGIKDD